MQFHRRCLGHRVAKPEGARRERGSALPLLGLSLAFVMTVVLILGAVADRVVTRSRAQSAADAAALAAVIEGEAGAERYAEANGAELVWFEQNGSAVVVRVAIDGVEAQASADRELRTGRG